MPPGGRKPDGGLIALLNRIAECRAMADREAAWRRLAEAFRAEGFTPADAARMASTALDRPEDGGGSRDDG